MKKKYFLFFTLIFFTYINCVYGWQQTNHTNSGGWNGGGENIPCTGPICCSTPIINFSSITTFLVDVFDLNGKKLSTKSSFINSSDLTFTAVTPIILEVREDIQVPSAEIVDASVVFYPERCLAENGCNRSEIELMEQEAHNNEAKRKEYTEKYCHQYMLKGDEAEKLKLKINYGVHKVTFYDDDGKEIVVEAKERGTDIIESSEKDYYKKVLYNISRTCLNRKTGKVRYINVSSQPCEEEEIDVNKLFGSVAKDKTIYFVPLNLKSSNDWKIKIENMDNAMADEETGTITSWVFDDEKDVMEFKIPIKQKFYYEKKDDSGKIKFSGYNFFIRQINPKKPFPNGITKCSYWDSKKSGDYIDTAIDSLGSSFTHLNYSFKVGNVSQTTLDANRKYNDEHLYTDWSDMNINGWSNNLRHGTDVKTGSTYALGCGPALKKYKENYKEVCDIK